MCDKKRVRVGRGKGGEASMDTVYCVLSGLQRVRLLSETFYYDISHFYSVSVRNISIRSVANKSISSIRNVEPTRRELCVCMCMCVFEWVNCNL